MHGSGKHRRNGGGYDTSLGKDDAAPPPPSRFFGTSEDFGNNFFLATSSPLCVSEVRRGFSILSPSCYVYHRAMVSRTELSASLLNCYRVVYEKVTNDFEMIFFPEMV